MSAQHMQDMCHCPDLLQRGVSEERDGGGEPGSAPHWNGCQHMHNIYKIP